jgi:hypothetical protein
VIVPVDVEGLADVAIDLESLRFHRSVYELKLMITGEKVRPYPVAQKSYQGVHEEIATALR